MRRYLGALALFVGGMLGFAGTASAHIPNVSDSCSGLSVSLVSYESASGPNLNNRVTVTIDGSSSSFDFDGSYSNVFSWAQTSNHTWSVVVDGNRLNGHPTQWDWSKSGDETACQTTTTSTTEPEEPTTTTTIVEEPTTTVTVTVPEETTTTLTPTTTIASIISVGTAPVPTTIPVVVCVAVGEENPNGLPICNLPATGSERTRNLTMIAVLLVLLGAVTVRLSSRPRTS